MLGQDRRLTTLHWKVEAAYYLSCHFALPHTVRVIAVMGLDSANKGGKMVDVVVELGAGKLHNRTVRSAWVYCTRLRVNGFDVDTPTVRKGLS